MFFYVSYFFSAVTNPLTNHKSIIMQQKLLSTLLLSSVLLLWGKAATAQPVLQYTAEISTGLTNPIDIANAGDGSNRVFIVQRGGTIRVYDQAFNYIGDFLTVTGISTSGEGGLLSMAFHPDYETNGYFYVYYTLPDNSLELARYQVSTTDSNEADAATKEVVLNIPHPVNTNHNGAKLLFGSDGYLYFGTGDGGGAGDVPNNAQSGNSLLGKMLRLNVTTTTTAPFYTIPPTNPYIADPGVLDEIWAMGLRNPWRWSFDRTTGDMWIADVGQGVVEEVNFRPADSTSGVNYGWRCYEGDSTYNQTGCLPASNYNFPVFGYGHNNTTGGFAVTGGYVYRGPDYPALNGYYICADYASGNQWVIWPDGSGGWNVYQQNSATFPTNIATFGEAENGTLYAASLSGNAVYKVELATVLPLTLVSFTGEYLDGAAALKWETVSEKDLDRFEIESSQDGIRYNYAGTVIAKNAPEGGAYKFDHYVNFTDRQYYRLKMLDKDGSFRYSTIITLLANTNRTVTIYPTVIEDGNMNVLLGETFSDLAIVNFNGSVVYEQNIDGQTGRINVPVYTLTPGMYFVHLIGRHSKEVHKIIVQ